jgi:8-oxo-dGTP pyrophosphatase MutT (NUDIX family)
MKKNFCPGYVSTSVGGHISTGESPEAAGKREMREEIGKKGSLKHMFSAWYEGESEIRKILHVYSSRIKPPFDLNKDEVERIEWLSHEELTKLPDTKIHPELKFIVNFLKNES